jgi:hypothetical protein
MGTGTTAAQAIETVMTPDFFSTRYAGHRERCPSLPVPAGSATIDQ